MASYKIQWKGSAAKELRTLPKDVIAEIVDRVTSLGEDPFPLGSKSSRAQSTPTGFASTSYRVIYTVARDSRLVEIVRVGHRQSIYKH